MPNWAFCSLSVEGNTKDVARFREEVRDYKGNFDLSLLHPMPKILEGTVSPTPNEDRLIQLLDMHERGVITYLRLMELRDQARVDIDRSWQAEKETGFANWYDWCNANWGTKWPPSDVALNDDEPGHLSFTFSSPWCPPSELIRRASLTFPLLTFFMNYTEESKAFIGCDAYRSGVLLATECFTFERNGMPDHLTEEYIRLSALEDDEERMLKLDDLEYDVLNFAEEKVRNWILEIDEETSHVVR